MNEALTLLSGMPNPETVRALEAEMLALPQVDLQTEHLIHGGFSVRTVFIPAGVVVTGALTNLDNICIVCGDITATTDEGTQRLTGFNVIPAGKGFKRAVYAHTDTFWTTIHRTDKATQAEVEDEMTNEAAMLQTRRDGITYAAPELIGG
jgi:hypothetical protein